MGGYNTYRVLLTDETAKFSLSVLNYGDTEIKVDENNDIESVRRTLDGMHFEYWLSSYPQEGEMRICDGEQWNLSITYNDGTIISSGGDNTYPENWNALLEFFGIDGEDEEEEEDENEEQNDVPQVSVVVPFPDFENLKASVEKLRTELSMLVLERDELLYVECKNIEMVYMLAIGGLEYKAYEIECAILRLKRKTELIQAKKNRQEKVVLSKIEELLDIEFAEYQVKLNEQIDKINAALERSHSEPLSEEEAHEMKKLYRAIVKSLHPDIHPDLSEAKIQMFHNAVMAYENGDISGLRIISAMVTEPVLPEEKPDAISQLIKEKERLFKLLQIVKDRIAEIKSDYPFTMKSLVQSPEKIEARKAELEARIKQLNETLAAYTEKIEKMLR